MKVKTIKIIDGIEITKPWSPAMYSHNDVVADEMKENIFTALNQAYKGDNEPLLRKISKYVCSYGFGDMYDIDTIHAETCKELDGVQTYWLNDIYPDMVEDGLVPRMSKRLVGFNEK